MKFKKNDEILVTGGKDRGKKGKIEQVLPRSSAVLVAGLNLYKRHLKKKDEKTRGGIIDFPRPIPVGRIAIICPKCKKQTRIHFTDKDKQRICSKCKQLI